MHRKQRKYLFLFIVCMAEVVLTKSALAAGIPFSVIGPHEYTLPLNFKPYLEFVQSVEVNDDRMSFDSVGNTQDSALGHTLTTSTKLAYLFQIKGLRKVGFEAEAILPASRVTGGPDAVTGIGDPVAGLAMWTKPTDHAVIGLQDYFVLPLGSQAFSGKHTSNIFSLLGDYVAGRWDFDGDLGVVAPLSYATRSGQPTQRAGNAYFANLRISYRLSLPFEPFTGLDWQNSAGAWLVNNGEAVPASNGHEIAALAGVMWHLPSGSLTASWHYGLSGRNVIRTDSLLMRWIYAF